MQVLALACCAATLTCSSGPLEPEPEPEPEPVLRITPSLDSVLLGGETRFSVVLITPDSQPDPVSWGTLDPLVATITSDGLAAGVGLGTARITATAGEVADTALLVVVPPAGGPGTAVFSLKLANGPWDVTRSAQGVVYVTRPLTDSIARVDLATETLLGSFVVGNRPDEVWFNQAGTRAFVTNLDDHTVGVIDVATHQQTGTYSVTGEPLRVRLGPGEASLYATLTNGTVAVLDAATGAGQGSIQVGSTPNGLALTGDGSRLYVSTTGGAVREISTGTNLILRTFAVGGMPQDIALAPGDGTLYVANEAGSVDVWSTVTGTSQGSVPVPGAFALALTPDGSQLWVTQPSAGTVSVIDCATLTVLRTIVTLGRPRHLVIAPQPLVAVVANEQGAVQIIR